MLDYLYQVTGLVVGVLLREGAGERRSAVLLSHGPDFLALSLHTMTSFVAIVFGKQPRDASEESLMRVSQHKHSGAHPDSLAGSGIGLYHCLAVSGYLMCMSKATARVLSALHVPPTTPPAARRTAALQASLRSTHLVQVALQLQAAGVRCASWGR